jgi:hypothetical protein
MLDQMIFPHPVITLGVAYDIHHQLKDMAQSALEAFAQLVETQQQGQ